MEAFGVNGSQRFRIAWREYGGPEVRPPLRSGFGKTVIERMAAMAVDGEIDLDFAAEGVSWTLDAPGDNVFYVAARAKRVQ